MRRFLFPVMPALHGPPPSYRLASAGGGIPSEKEHRYERTSRHYLVREHRSFHHRPPGPSLARRRRPGYTEARKVTQIYKRHEDEFTSGLTEVLKLSTSGENKDLRRESRIFSPRCCHLIAMFSRTARAKTFRHWVLDVLEGLASPRALPPPAITKILVTLRDGRAVHTEPVPDDALVTSIGQVRDLLAKRGYLVIDRQELIATHRPCGYLQAAIAGAADAWNQMAETTRVDGVRV